jgi:two-component system cell cycle sensor histidine kinase PleC
MTDGKPGILIVDDIPSNIYDLSSALLDDYDITFATSGEKALRLAGELLPDLILLDVMMPGMSGYEVCRILKSQPRTQGIPVIFISAREDSASETRGLEIGAVDFITKPVNPAIVRARVRNHLTQRRVEETLRGTARRLAEAERLARVGAWEWDLGSGRIEVSDEWQSIHGWGDPQLGWDELLGLVHPEDREAVAAGFRHGVNHGVNLDLSYRVRRGDDQMVRIVQTRGRVQVSGEGTVLRLSGATQDITDQRLNEIELGRLKNAAEAANRAKSAFLATMSHELRTPLTSIIGFSEIMRDQSFGPVGTPVYAEYANDINESGLYLLDLINDILDVAKIESGKMILDHQHIDLRHVLSSACRLVKQRVLRHELEMITRVIEPVPSLWADERAVKQVVYNLLSNAIKFTPRGGRVLLEALAGTDGGVEIRVSDTGIGIPAGELSRVMLPFEQVENHYSRSAGGTGLGLPLIKGLVELHGGTVTIESKLGEGTTVRVGFPACPVAGPAVPMVA